MTAIKQNQLRATKLPCLEPSQVLPRLFRWWRVTCRISGPLSRGLKQLPQSIRDLLKLIVEFGFKMRLALLHGVELFAQLLKFGLECIDS